jgi:hypothetical protein
MLSPYGQQFPQLLQAEICSLLQEGSEKVIEMHFSEKWTPYNE